MSSAACASLFLRSPHDRNWAIWNGDVYDLSAYFQTQTNEANADTYAFLYSDLTSLWQAQSGQDITSDVNSVLSKMNTTYAEANIQCIKNLFYWGTTDFRDTPRCQVQNILLIVASGVIMSSMAIKCE